MTALFYVAVHEVRAFFASHGVALWGHAPTRLAFLNNKPLLNTMSSRYDRLYQYSVQVRYYCQTPSAAKFTNGENALNEIRTEIGRISALATRLNPPPPP